MMGRSAGDFDWRVASHKKRRSPQNFVVRVCGWVSVAVEYPRAPAQMLHQSLLPLAG